MPFFLNPAQAMAFAATNTAAGATSSSLYLNQYQTSAMNAANAAYSTLPTGWLTQLIGMGTSATTAIPSQVWVGARDVWDESWRPYPVSQQPRPISSPAIINRRAIREEERQLERLAELRRDNSYFQFLAEHDAQEEVRIRRRLEARRIEQVRLETEARIARERLEVENRVRAAEYQAQYERERAAREVAAAVARDLLLEHLTEEQRRTFIENGWFVVQGGRTRTRYRINARSYQGNVEVLQWRGDGVTHRLCGHARAGIPLCDHLLAQKITLELAEDDFLRIANRH